VVLSVGIGAATAAVAAPGASLADSCTESGPAGALYKVNVCITRPEGDAHVTGDVPVAATATVEGTDPGIEGLTFFLDGEYLLTDDQAPYESSLASAKFEDGVRTLEVEARMGDGFVTERTTASFAFQNGVSAPAANDGSLTPNSETDSSAGALVVAATDDGAGGEESAGAVSELVTVEPTNLIAPASVTTPTGGVPFRDGFESGDFSAWSEANGLTIQQSHVFSGSYAAQGAASGTGGASTYRELEEAETDLYYVARFKVLSRAPATNINLLRFRNNLASSRPIATVYVTSTDKLGLRNDVRGIATTSSAVAPYGAWHTVQVHVTVDGASSRTEVWLDGVAVPALAQTDVDLGTNPIGRLELGDPAGDKTYEIAYDEVVIDRQLIGDLLSPTAPANLAAAAPSGLAVELTWTPATDDIGVSGYDIYRSGSLVASIPAASSYTDLAVSPRTDYTYSIRARDAAGNVSDVSRPAFVSTGDVFRDDFESGDLAKWTTAAGLTVQQQIVDGGAWAARAVSDGSAGSSAQVRLPSTVNALYYRARFRVTSQGANPINLLRFRTAVNGALASVYSSNTGKIGYRDDTSGTTVTTLETVASNVWHELQLYVGVNGGARHVEVWLDGAKVITQTDPSGASSIGRLELGDPLSGRSFDVAFDNVVAGSTSFADVAPPSTPENLRSLAHSASEVELEWELASDDVGVTGYRIYRDGVAIADADATTSWITDTQLTSGTTYKYSVTALDAVGRESPESNTVAVTTSDVTKPSAPERLSAVAAGGPDRVELSWSPASDDVGVSGYRIYRDGSAVPLASVGASTTSFSDAAVAPAREYSYTVTAVDAGGNESDAREPARVRTADSVAPNAPVLSATAISGTLIALHWTLATDNVGVTGYRIYRNGSSTPLVTLGGAQTWYSDAPLTPATTYSYIVAAVDAAGNLSAASNEASATTRDSIAPTAPAVAVDAPNVAATSSSGTATTPDSAAPTAPTDPAASADATAGTAVFTDDFESGKLSQWTAVRGLRAQKVHRFAGAWGARAHAGKKVARFATKRMPRTYTDLYYTVRLKIISSTRANVDVIGFRTAANANLISLRYDSRRRLRYVNGATGKSPRSTSVLALNKWHELKLHVVVNGSASLVEVWLNGTKVPALSRMDTFNSPIGMIVAGETRAEGRYRFALDNVVIDTRP
jgi:fibronectin type 3 domain-containing protein